MTILVQRDGVIYTDSRTTNRIGVVSDDACKISLQPKNRPVEEYGIWGDEPVLAVAGTGRVDSITALTNLILKRGETGVEVFRELRREGLTKPTSCKLFVLTANWCYIVEGFRDYPNALSVHRRARSDLLVLGSGLGAAKVVARYLKPDPVGMVCAAISIEKSCGGSVLRCDTNKKELVVTSRHYRYPFLRTLYGSAAECVKGLCLRWFGFWPY